MSDRPDPPANLTLQLNGYKSAPDQAREVLWEELFPTLRRLAQSRIGSSGLTGRESPTELVVSLYPGLDRTLKQEETQFENRSRFFSYAALSMRRQLVAQMRRRAAEELLDDSIDVTAHVANPALMLVLEQAIDAVRKEFPRATEAFMLRYYLGHGIDEILDIMSDEYKTKALVSADLTLARKALARALQAD
jgi:DNA-directed RNA polymerase specialized sigma24 family protein